jgi:hypothetical protein
MLANYRVATQLVASQVVISSIELVLKQWKSVVGRLILTAGHSEQKMHRNIFSFIDFKTGSNKNILVSQKYVLIILTTFIVILN